MKKQEYVDLLELVLHKLAKQSNENFMKQNTSYISTVKSEQLAFTALSA